jgi:hypothetical protein
VGTGFTRCARSSITGATGTGEPLAISAAPGQRRLNTAADHKAGLADTAGGTHEFVHYLHVQRLQYSVGFQVTAARPGPVARGRRRSYGVKRLFVIQSALTMVRSAPRWGSERFGSG